MTQHTPRREAEKKTTGERSEHRSKPKRATTTNPRPPLPPVEAAEADTRGIYALPCFGHKKQTF